MIALIRHLPIHLLAFLATQTVSMAEGVDFQAYEADAQTLHLWHLNESKPPFSDQGSQAFLLEGLHNGALADRPSLPGLGRSVLFRTHVGGVPGKPSLAGAIVTASAQLADGPQDNLPEEFRYFGPEGAFTYEMVVKFDTLPGAAAVIAAGLLSMDGDGDDPERVFNFRIEKEGFLSFIPLRNGGPTGMGLATIPNSGPNAIDTQHWFHTAVTYDGNAGVTNNLKLYWTRLSPGLTEANLIGNGTLSQDFNGLTGDLAIGNEARSTSGNAEAEPFPGQIDEVRISGVARDPTDFFYIAPEQRISPEQIASRPKDSESPRHIGLKLAGVFVDGIQTSHLLLSNNTLRLGSGLHRLDFDFGFDRKQIDGNVKLRCQLEGIDERWQQTDRGMSLICQALDKNARVISQSHFPFAGRSIGWQTTLEDSEMRRRIEPVFIPPEATVLRLTLSSGSPDTSGLLAIDHLTLDLAGGHGTPLWTLKDLETPIRAAREPEGWQRKGSDPAIARIIFRLDKPVLALVDGNQQHHGEWSFMQPLAARDTREGTFALSWEETYNITSGSLHRATYVNVPAGSYMFRAIGLAGANDSVGGGIALSILIEPPLWQRPWFWPAIAALSVGLLASGLFSRHRRNSQRRMELLHLQNALEQDRTRIARDLHDDIGTRVTVINMTTALAKRDLERDLIKTRQHLDSMSDSTRELVVAMEDLVWAVDPTCDTLDHLATHLTRLTGEMFRDSPVRCHLDIPALLPARSLGAEFRHHLALAVKESLHNVLQHAGPCEVFLTLYLDGAALVITVRDTGCGFDQTARSNGHGLSNAAARIQEIGGDYSITSPPNGGTCVLISCQPIANIP